MCYIFTKNPNFRTTGKNIVQIKNNIIEFVNNLVNSDGKDIWLVGGADIISILLNANLVDEIILSIHPIILGKGIPLFKDIQIQTNLKLFNSITFESGLVQLYYKI